MSVEERPGMPGYGRFAWMFFMQPISLHRRLKACGIEFPGAPAWRLWLKSGEDRSIHRQYVRRCLTLILAMGSLTFGIAVSLAVLGVNVDLLVVAIRVALCCLIGLVVGSAIDLAFGASISIALCFGLGLVGGVAGDADFSALAIGLAIASIALGLAIVGASSRMTWGVSLAESIREAFGVAGRVAVSLATGVAGGLIIAGITFGVAGKAAEVVIFFATLPLLFFRFPFLLIETPLQISLTLRHRWTSTFSLYDSPIFWHELSYLPLPLLAEHIERTAVDHPEAARRALDQCAIIPGQRGIGERVLERLRLKELADIVREERFDDLINGYTLWLPPEADAEGSATGSGLRLAARYLRAGHLATIHDQRLRHYGRARDAIQELQPYRRKLDSPGRVGEVVGAWTEAVDRLIAEAEADGSRGLPNPFRAGEALEPDLGRELFRGRESVVRQIERLLADPERAGSIALLAPRRCGKTSLLRMLPILLPDAVCVFFDLQGHPVDTPAGFFRALDRAVREQGFHRGLRLPRLDDGPPFDAAWAWIDELERSAGDRRILLCLDEFETLETSFPDRGNDLRRLMGLLRSTIQHRRKVRLLISGEAPFDELGGLWHDHFISVRELRFDHLDPEDAVDLVRRPTDDFPTDALGESVARRIVERTGGQPFLVQLYAQELVELLNEQERLEAELDDLEAVEEKVLDGARYYFNDRWNRASDDAQNALAALARGETLPELARDPRRWLQHRALIDDELRLRIPVFGRFLVDEELV